MFFFKLPASLPLLKRSTSRKGKEKVETHTSSDGGGVSNKGCGLEELPDGYMGKMLVYKSGAIKLKLGDALYDVSQTMSLLKLGYMHTQTLHCFLTCSWKGQAKFSFKNSSNFLLVCPAKTSCIFSDLCWFKQNPEEFF